MRLNIRLLYIAFVLEKEINVTNEIILKKYNENYFAQRVTNNFHIECNNETDLRYSAIIRIDTELKKLKENNLMYNDLEEFRNFILENEYIRVSKMHADAFEIIRYNVIDMKIFNNMSLGDRLCYIYITVKNEYLEKNYERRIEKIRSLEQYKKDLDFLVDCEV